MKGKWKAHAANICASTDTKGWLWNWHSEPRLSWPQRWPSVCLLRQAKKGRWGAILIGRWGMRCTTYWPSLKYKPIPCCFWPVTNSAGLRHISSHKSPSCPFKSCKEKRSSLCWKYSHRASTGTTYGTRMVYLVSNDGFNLTFKTLYIQPPLKK